MAQSLHPQFGEYATDITLSHSSPLPPGVYAGMNPTIGGAGGGLGWTVTLSPDSSGFSYWRTAGKPADGRFVIQETTAVQIHINPPDATHPRIDLVAGLHRRVAGPLDPGTLEPTGQFIPDQHAAYIVMQGTPSATPTEPPIPDPFDGSGARAVVIARVIVPPTGSPTIERYPDTDLRIEFMRSVIQEVIRARSIYNDLPARLDAMGTTVASATQINAVSFRGTTANTGSTSTYATVPLTTTTRYGDAVAIPVNNIIGLTRQGLYEITAFHKLETGFSGHEAGASIRAWLTRDGASPQLLDLQLDSNTSEITQALYAMVYVDPTWTNVGVKFERAGWPVGTMRGSVKFLGNPSALEPLGISTGNATFTASSGQAYPTSATITLAAYSPIGATTWAVVSGAGLMDGTTNPKAEIINGNQLKITWESAPPSFPHVSQARIRVTDSATPPRTYEKTITITLNGAAALAITTQDFESPATGFPWNVDFYPQATGGATPYTWQIVADVDTTLPNASIIDGPYGTRVSGTAPELGVYKVHLRVTDSQPTPSQVEKTIYINVVDYYGPGGGGPGGGGPGGGGPYNETPY